MRGTRAKARTVAVIACLVVGLGAGCSPAMATLRAGSDDRSVRDSCASSGDPNWCIPWNEAGAIRLRDHLATLGAAERRIVANRMSTLAAVADPTVQQAVLAVTIDAGVNSALGLLTLASGQTPAPIRERALTSAAATTGPGVGELRARTAAGFLLGQLLEADGRRDEAAGAYERAASGDPNDLSGGFAWQSAIAGSRLLAALCRAGEAQTLLDRARAMPDVLDRRRLTRDEIAGLPAAIAGCPSVADGMAR